MPCWTWGENSWKMVSEHLKNSEADEPDEDLLACFTAIFQAVPSSSKSDLDKMLYLIDLSLADEFDLTDGMNFLFEREWPTAVWAAVADEMNRRLESTPASRTGWHRLSKRDELYQWLGQALEASGRGNEVLPLLEHEAVASGSYLQLVDAMLSPSSSRTMPVAGFLKVSRRRT